MRNGAYSVDLDISVAWEYTYSDSFLPLVGPYEPLDLLPSVLGRTLVMPNLSIVT